MSLEIKRILVPLDFSANSERALEYAREVASRFGAALHLLHVCEVPAMMTGSMDAYAIAYTDWSQRLGDEAERELAKYEGRISGIPVSTEVLFGNPSRCIITAANTNAADLIVMGTHGHGAVMHVLMGNVAERVVRTAKCPVLTVRVPAEDEVAKKPAVTAAGVAAAVLLAAGLLLSPALAAPIAAQTAAPTQLKQSVPGGEVYRTYCAACHGTGARGDGPLAESMTRKPPNLTEIARRNGGQYPGELVFRTIDGRNKVRGHGGPDMPVWGDAFSRARDGGDEDSVKKVIQSLVDYLESIQLRPVH